MTALRTLRLASNRLGAPQPEGGAAAAASALRIRLPQLSVLDVGCNGLASLRAFSLCQRLQTLRAPGNRRPVNSKTVVLRLI